MIDNKPKRIYIYIYGGNPTGDIKYEPFTGDLTNNEYTSNVQKLLLVDD